MKKIKRKKVIQKDQKKLQAEYLFNQGVKFQGEKRLDEAIIYYQKAIQLSPSNPKAYNNIGGVFQEKGNIDEAIDCYKKALQFNPNNANTYNNLGSALKQKGIYDEALIYCQKALQLNPNNAEAKCNLGIIYTDIGKLDLAEKYYREALQIKPDSASWYSNLLLLMLYDSSRDIQTIFSEHLKFAHQYTKSISCVFRPHCNKRIHSRRLKIGYVSPDFRRHSVAYFIEPIIAFHNREYFEIFCYSNVLIEDDVTQRIKPYSDKWRNIVGLSDEIVADLIHNDEIDILIDLAGHTAGNRILLFARKPAPIQVSWIGYPFTTGLSTIDYKIVDNYTDPLENTEHYYTEKLMRLPKSFLCYRPYDDSPEIKELPALMSGNITFGSFNNFPKISSEVVKLWTRILRKIPHSRLILKSKSFVDKSICNSFAMKFNQGGIEKERIELLPMVTPMKEHLNTYNRIDIGLDTYPYNGTTTSCEALWMGVPVISLGGNSHSSRVGVSLLSNVGLSELIARTYDEYVEIAVNLAKDLEKLKSLREHLRDMMKCSPLCDAKRFTANLELCYREMWKTWCKSF